MSDEKSQDPDITLTLDRNGVICSVAPSDALEHGLSERWRGRTFCETLPPDSADRITQTMERARASGESYCIRVRQRLPSGRELPLEYTAFSLGEDAGFVAIGRNLRDYSEAAIRRPAELRAGETDNPRLRDLESRYQAVLDASREAVALVSSSDLKIVEANAFAIQALGLQPGARFALDVAAYDFKALAAAMDTAKSQGRAPNVMLHVSDGSKWCARASWVKCEAETLYLLQFSRLVAAYESPFSAGVPLEQILRRLPEPFVIADREGTIVKANSAFLDLVDLSHEEQAIGRNLQRWVSPSGETLPSILDLAQKEGGLRGVPCLLERELGPATPVEISAVGDKSPLPLYIGLLIRDLNAEFEEAASGLDLDPDRSTKEPQPTGASLEAVVKAAVETIERRYIEEALAKTHGNRTLAARTLGLSRQTLHVKLNRYKLD